MKIIVDNINGIRIFKKWKTNEENMLILKRSKRRFLKKKVSKQEQEKTYVVVGYLKIHEIAIASKIFIHDKY
jgi:hypothetical protein